MKVSVASSSLVLLCVIGAVLSEPPRGDAAAAGGPYPPSGWKPSGRAFLLPVRAAPRDAYKAPPQGKYGAPAEPKPSYGPPAAPKPSYGPPSTSTTEAPTTEAPTTTEVVTEPVTETPEYEDDTVSDVDAPRGDGGNGGASAFASANAFASADARAFARARAEADSGDNEDGASGLYFVLLPDGRLQRVAYTTSRDQRVFQRLVAEPAPRNAGFLAIQYQDVSPIQAPVYSYGPDNALLRIY